MLLFSLGQLGLQGGLLLNLGLLVTVDCLGGYEIVQGLPGMLLQKLLSLGDGDLVRVSVVRPSGMEEVVQASC